MSSGTRTSVPLKFQVGEIVLFTVTLPAINMPFRCSDYLGKEIPPLPEFYPLPDGTELRIFRSRPVSQPLSKIQLLPDAIRYVPSLYKRFFTKLEGSFELYLRRFSAKSRSTLTRKLRKFTESNLGHLHWQKYSGKEEMEDFYRLARAVSSKTYQERLLDAGLPDDPAYLEHLKELASHDRVRAYILFNQGAPAAYLCCPVVDDILIYEHLGYDPRFAHLSPGTVLQYIAFENLFAENKFKFFDFTEGEGPHKEFFSTESLICGDVYFFRRTLRNHLLVRAHDALSRSSAALVRLLDKIGAKAYIKKFIRQAA